eukprot:6929874-Pyramimonas_sp.AAC.1
MGKPGLSGARLPATAQGSRRRVSRIPPRTRSEGAACRGASVLPPLAVVRCSPALVLTACAGVQVV